MLLFEQRRVLVDPCFREQSGSRSSAEAGSPFRRVLISSRGGDSGPAPVWQRREGKTRCLELFAVRSIPGS